MNRNKKILANALTLALIAGVAGAGTLGFASDGASVSGNNVSGNDVSGNDVSGNDVSGNDVSDNTPTYALGDVNLDGAVNYLDAITVLSYQSSLMTITDEQVALGDVNGDSTTNYLDAILILQYDSKLIDSFPAEEQVDVSGNDVSSNDVDETTAAEEEATTEAAEDETTAAEEEATTEAVEDETTEAEESTEAEEETTKASQTVTASVDSDIIIKGETAQITAEGTGDITYVSSDESVATVDSTGLITTVGAGTATITVTAAGDDETEEGSATVDVTVVVAAYTSSYTFSDSGWWTQDIIMDGDAAALIGDDIEPSDVVMIVFACDETGFFAGYNGTSGSWVQNESAVNEIDATDVLLESFTDDAGVAHDPYLCLMLSKGDGVDYTITWTVYVAVE